MAINIITSDEIYEDLCYKIEKLEYMPGEKLSENELAGIYGVSRHIIRGALARLKERRLVEVYPQRGTYVSLIDMDYIEDILFMREAVEQEALYRIFEEGKAQEITGPMKAAVEAQKAIPDDENYNQRFYELDNQYHLVLLNTVGRPHVMELISQPYIHIRRWRNYEVRTRERMDEIIKEHEEIVVAIEKGEEDKAHRLLHNHLDTVGRYSKPLKESEAQFFV